MFNTFLFYICSGKPAAASASAASASAASASAASASAASSFLKPSTSTRPSKYCTNTHTKVGVRKYNISFFYYSHIFFWLQTCIWVICSLMIWYDEIVVKESTLAWWLYVLSVFDFSIVFSAMHSIINLVLILVNKQHQ